MRDRVSAPSGKISPDRGETRRYGTVLAMLALCALVAAGVWGGIALFLAHEHGQAFDQARRDGANLSLAFERETDRFVRSIDSSLISLRQEHEEGREQFARAARELKQGPLGDAILQFGIIDADGLVSWWSEPTNGPVFLGERPHFRSHQSATADRLIVSPPFFGKVSKRWSVHFSRRITGADGRFAGVVVIAVAAEQFSRFLKDIDVGPNGAIGILHSSGSFIARSGRQQGPEPVAGNAVDLSPLKDFPGQSTAWWLRASPIDGVSRLSTYRGNADYPLAVTVSLAEDDILAAYHAQRRAAIWAGLAITLCLGLFAIWLVRTEGQRAASERRANENEARFRRMFEKAPLAYQSLDAEARILDVNEAWENLFGYRRADVQGQPIANFVAEGSLDKLAREFPEFLRRGHVDDVEFEIVRKDGSTRLVNVNGRISTNADGSFRQTHSILIDVTRARTQEMALKASEARLRGIVENVNVATWELDLATWQFTYVSPQVEAMFGYPAAAWLQPNFWPEHLHPDDRVAAVQFCVGCTHRLEDHDFEYRFLKQDGSSVWVRDIVKVIADDRGAPVRLTGVMIDVTAAKTTAAELVKQRALLRSLIDSVPDLIFFKDKDSVYLGCNRAFAEFAGRPESEQIGRTDFDFFARDIAESFRRNDREMLDRGDSRRNEEWVTYADGRRVLLETLKAPFRGPQGEPLGIIGVSRDITERRQTEENALLAQSVFESTTEGIVVTDAAATIVSVNPAFSAITGWSASEAIGQKPAILKSGHHPPEFYASMWAALLDSGHWQGELWNRRKDGEIYIEWMTINAIRDANGNTVKYVSLFSDITLRKHQEEEIWRQANFDPLTGLANRNLFHDRLDRALARARRNQQQVGLMFIDLDRFKWINDTLGHEAGDSLLSEAAARLRGCVREEDTVARLGGDEFTIVVQGLADHEPLEAVADKVLAALVQPFALNGTLQYISASIGITLFPADGESSGSLLRNADIAMYQAKEAGRNRYQFYSPNMQAYALAHVQIEQELRQAIAGGGFVIYYQPIVDADSSELLGAEALLRWRHPTRGLLAAADFLPVAEDSGLILPIGEWVIGEVCRQWRAWVDAGHAPLRLAINVSTVHFRHAGLGACLADAIARHDVPGCMLSIEVTEALMMLHGEVTAERLQELKGLGVRYALDDFGTGHSSLSTLKRFPFEAVKIDRSFIADSPGNLDDAHLVEAIVFMAHSLNLQVIAEGVEDEGQLNFLRDLGCDYIQGYLVSPPLPAADFAALLERRIMLPHARATVEKSRFLAALRHGNVDPEQWVRRLLAERDPELAADLTDDACRIGDLDLRPAIAAHMRWRGRLETLLLDDRQALAVDDAAGDLRCGLGRWLESQRGQPLARHPGYSRLVDADREFHRLASGILADLKLGRRAEARRRTRGLPFRKASQAVVTALVDLCVETHGAGRATASGARPAPAPHS